MTFSERTRPESKSGGTTFAGEKRGSVAPSGSSGVEVEKGRARVSGGGGGGREIRAAIAGCHAWEELRRNLMPIFSFIHAGGAVRRTKHRRSTAAAPRPRAAPPDPSATVDYSTLQYTTVLLLPVIQYTTPDQTGMCGSAAVACPIIATCTCTGPPLAILYAFFSRATAL